MSSSMRRPSDTDDGGSYISTAIIHQVHSKHRTPLLLDVSMRIKFIENILISEQTRPSPRGTAEIMAGRYISFNVPAAGNTRAWSLQKVPRQAAPDITSHY